MLFLSILISTAPIQSTFACPGLTEARNPELATAFRAAENRLRHTRTMLELGEIGPARNMIATARTYYLALEASKGLTERDQEEVQRLGRELARVHTELESRP